MYATTRNKGKVNIMYAYVVSVIMLLCSAVLAISGDAEYSINVGIWATVFAIWGTIWGIRDEIKKAAK
jgi:hypothetical protein